MQTDLLIQETKRARPPPTAHASLAPKIKMLHNGLKRGAYLAEQLRAHSTLAIPLLKSQQITPGMSENLFFELTAECDPQLTDLLLEGIRWTQQYRFGITNADHNYSEYENERTWRAFVANPGTKRSPTGITLPNLQDSLFRRVLSKIEGTLIFPAMGLDGISLTRGPVISVAPSKKGEAQSTKVPSHKIHKRIQDATIQDFQNILRRQKGFDGQRILICKGLQSILNPEEILKLARSLSCDHVVVFSCPASGFLGRPQAVPVHSPELNCTLIAGGYSDETLKVFHESEISELAKVNALVANRFAWKTGFFPATRVEVYAY